MRSRYFLLTCVTKPRQELSLSRLPTREQPGDCLSSGSGGKPAGRCALCSIRFPAKHPLVRTPETTIACRLNPMATGTPVTVPDESFHGPEPPNESILLNVVQTHRSLGARTRHLPCQNFANSRSPLTERTVRLKLP